MHSLNLFILEHKNTANVRFLRKMHGLLHPKEMADDEDYHTMKAQICQIYLMKL